ncbi:SDR family NAD(P)-dependent oxidoreductase [Nocardia iowensis]|uniref:SDR family NAD(P)-dependent oxidoreductase n=1 Tax=Nocardia iowensis TaxID=204891 RepID=UPI002484BF0E|nr:SDR family NAD(P)-dependent oxidoreductase [Nocardia iowensis]
MTDDASIRAAAEQVESEQGQLDALVNNAGIAGPEREPDEVTGADMTAVLDTNVVGVVRVTHAFLPLLRRSDAGTIVNVAYNTSKTAVAMLTVQYAKAFPW